MGDIVTGTLNYIDTMLATFIFDGYVALVDELSPALDSLLILYVCLYGWLLMNGLAEASWREASKRLFSVLFVYVLVTEIGYFSSFVVDLFTDGPAALAAVVIEAATGETVVSANATLQAVFDGGMELAERVADAGGWSDPGAYLLAFLIGDVTVLVVAYALFLVVLAKVALAVLLVLAVIFIPLLLFAHTKGLFEGWLRQAINYALVPMITYAVLGVMLSIMDSYIDHALSMTMNQDGVSLTEIAPTMLVGVLTFLILLQVLGIAGGLAGGMSLSTMAMGSRVAGWARSGIGAPGRMRNWQHQRQQRRLARHNYQQAKPHMKPTVTERAVGRLMGRR